MPPKTKAKGGKAKKAAAGGKKGGKKKRAEGETEGGGGGGEPSQTAEQREEAQRREERAAALRVRLREIEAETAEEEARMNEYRQEKEVVAQFWEHEKERREATKLALRDKLREKQDAEEKHAFELKLYKTKVKNLLYEQQTSMTEAKIDSETGIKQAQVVQRDEEHQHFLSLRSIKRLRNEMQSSHEALVTNLREEQATRFRELREQFEGRAAELTALHREKERVAREGMEQRKSREVKKIVLEKDRRIQKLMAEHKKAFDAIKAYYRDITHSNLDLIKTLKEELSRLRAADVQRQKQLGETKRYHSKLVEPLQQNLHLLEELKGDLQAHERNQTELSVVGDRLAVVEDGIRQLSWNTEVLQQKYDQVDEERAELRDKLGDTLLEVQQKAGFRRLLLERKVHALAEDLEKTEAALAEVLASTSLQPEVVGDIRRNLHDVLEDKNRAIKALEERVNDLRTYYYDTVHAYESKMLEHRVPLEEMGFVPADV